MKRHLSALIAIAAVLAVCPAFAETPATQPAAQPSTQPAAAPQKAEALQRLLAAAQDPTPLTADAQVVSFGDGYTVSTYQVHAPSGTSPAQGSVGLLVRQDTRTGESVILDDSLPASLMPIDSRSIVISCARAFTATPQPLVITSGESTLTVTGPQAESLRNALQQEHTAQFLGTVADSTHVFVLKEIPSPPTNNFAASSQLILSAVPVSGTGSTAYYTVPAPDAAPFLAKSPDAADASGLTVKDGTITLGKDITLTFDGKTFKKIDLGATKAGPPAQADHPAAAPADNASASHTPAPTPQAAAGL